MDEIQKKILAEVADLHGVPEGAYNIRANGAGVARSTTANIDIVTKTDKPGIDIIIKPGTKNESVHIPVVISESGLKDMVYNDFFIGEDADVTIVAGCGISNCGDQDSQHDGIHTFHVGKNAKVKYVEKHYGEGDGRGARILNPVTEVYQEEGSYVEMEMVQIKGVDSTVRTNIAELKEGATLSIHEALMTHGTQKATSDYKVELNGEGSSADVVSRSVAKDDSEQIFAVSVEMLMLWLYLSLMQRMSMQHLSMRQLSVRSQETSLSSLCHLDLRKRKQKSRSLQDSLGEDDEQLW